jgi:iron complex outermembrane receptor protein
MSNLFKAALLAGAFVLPGAAHAQSDGSTKAPAAADLDEIIVTAQRRSERLQDVPMSITALSTEMLSRSGISTTTDLARVTPGLILPKYGIGIQPSLRGVSSQGSASGDAPNVAIYIDGVYTPIPAGNMFDLADAQQIEVLKGPQGTLYGQNATGGAILVTSLAPSFTHTGKLTVGYGNYDDKVFSGYVSGPLSEKLAFSIAGKYEDRDGFRKNVITGQRDLGLRSKLVRGKLLFQPNDDAKITLTAFYSKLGDSTSMSGFAINHNSASLATFPNAPSITSQHQYEADPLADTIMETYGASLRAEVNSDWGTFNFITSYNKAKFYYLADVDFSVVRNQLTSNTANTYSRFDNDIFVNEINFASRKIGPLSFTAGGFYLKADSINHSYFTLYSPVLPPAPLGSVLFRSLGEPEIDKKILAGYVEGAYDITDKLVFTLGGRYSRETQTAYAGIRPAAITVSPFNDTVFSKFVPRGTLRYAINESSNIYASVSQGFKSGVMNTSLLTTPPADPEVLTAYEVGYKGRPIDNLTINLAAFYYDYKDLQVFRYVPPVAILQNAAKARIKGIDVDASLNVTPEFTLSGGAEFLFEAKYTSFPNAAVIVPVASGFGNTTVIADLSGNRMIRAPKVTANVAANYQHETDIGDFGGFVALYYNSGFYWEVGNRVKEGSYTTIDAELSFSPTSMKGLRFVAWGRNLADTGYLEGTLISSSADGGAYAPPRTFGVRLEYKY